MPRETHSSERMKSMRFVTLSLASGTSCGTSAGPRRLKTLFSGVSERNSCVSSHRDETHFVDLLVLLQLREQLLLGINCIVQIWGQAARSFPAPFCNLAKSPLRFVGAISDESVADGNFSRLTKRALALSGTRADAQAHTDGI